MSAGPVGPLLPDAIASGMVPGLGRRVAGPLQLTYGPDLQARVRVPQKDADGASVGVATAQPHSPVPPNSNWNKNLPNQHTHAEGKPGTAKDLMSKQLLS